MTLKTSKKSNPASALSRRELISTAAAAGLAMAGARSSRGDTNPATADYIVIGSGPGGGPLACNLARAGFQVVLLEAGSPAYDPDLQVLMKVPVFFANATADPRIAWEFYVRHYSNTAQQKLDPKYYPAPQDGILYPRASTIGGCGVHNVLVMMYPSNGDWQYIIDQTGDSSYAPDKMRTIFQRMEQCRYTGPTFFPPDTAQHGFDGWQPMEMADPQTYLADSQLTEMMQVAANRFHTDFSKYAKNALDPNDYSVIQNDSEGLYSIPMSRLDGSRWGIRDRILETAAEYPNLTVLTNCLVTRVIMNGTTAVGVEYMQGPNLYRASPLSDPKAAAPQLLQIKANREVIVSAGTFNSPQILKLSGIGATSELSQFGIKTAVELPGVGMGMMDRYETSVVTQLSTPFTLFNLCAPQTPNDPCFAQFLGGSGPYATNLTAAAGLIKSNLFRPERDLLIMLAPGPFHGYFPGWQNLVVNPTQFSWLILKAHTQNSAGTVMLRSNDPRDMPLINMHYFSEGNDSTGTDLAGITNGIQLARQLNQQLGLSLSDELFPGPTVQTMVDMQNYAQNTAWGHHAACSNRMGKSTDSSAVVDSNFKVIGATNLRVVDASVFPRIPGFYPMVAIQMLSEKASDTILAGR